ncbi:MAG: hypothetical protein D4R64_05845 [Porphyromonadaceae bacterium]|nr:MAG: hypothetical protein D4R64_05845 [Porphyromonadaceae bacterium]
MTDLYIDIGQRILEFLVANDGHGELVSKHFPDVSPAIVVGVIKQLEDSGLIIYDRGTAGKSTRLTSKGFYAGKIGLRKYLIEKDEGEKIDSETKKLNLKKLQFYDRVKWWPLVISILSLVIAIIAIFYKVK